jgi:hypothetical protein
VIGLLCLEADFPNASLFHQNSFKYNNKCLDNYFIKSVDWGFGEKISFYGWMFCKKAMERCNLFGFDGEFYHLLHELFIYDFIIPEIFENILIN